MPINKNTKFGISACQASSGFKKISGVGFSISDFSLNKSVGSSMSIKKLNVEVRFSWWLKYIYIPAVKYFCLFFGCGIDEERFNYWVKLGSSIKIKPVDLIEESK